MSANHDQLWYSFNGACLTASAAAGTGQCYNCGNSHRAVLPSDHPTTVKSCRRYTNGVAVRRKHCPTPIYSGALRFTTAVLAAALAAAAAQPERRHHFGKFYSSTPDPDHLQDDKLSRRLYRNSTRNPDGADGMSFFLIDRSVTPNIGSLWAAWVTTCPMPIPDLFTAWSALRRPRHRRIWQFLNSGDNTGEWLMGSGQVANRIACADGGNLLTPGWPAITLRTTVRAHLHPDRLPIGNAVKTPERTVI